VREIGLLTTYLDGTEVPAIFAAIASVRPIAVRRVGHRSRGIVQTAVPGDAVVRPMSRQPSSKRWS
jgi:hypothetical protein